MADKKIDISEKLIEMEEQQNKIGDKTVNQAERLLKLALQYRLFHDEHKEAYMFLDGEAVPLRSKKIKQFLSHLLYKEEKKIPNSDAINQAITTLEGKAIYENQKIPLHNRIAKYNDAFWYDLGYDKAIKITPDGWEILAAPILFKRYSHQERQIATAMEGGDPREVFKFLNIGKDNQLLVLVYIISCFVPDIPHPIFHPHGDQGSGKTTLCRVIKKLCDPSTIPTVITPRDNTELIRKIAHNHVCLFDNMSKLPSWMSDILAQACTGGGFSKRQLYTDDDDIIYQVKRAIGLNGINLLISKPDLMDRSILLHLERISPAGRMDEENFWESFELARPSILGGILDTLSKAMAYYPKVNLRLLPRMADFVKWGYAIACALDEDGELFLQAYQKNIERQNEEVIQGNTLAQAVAAFMGNHEIRSWDGTIKQAWKELHDIVDPNKSDPTFPKSERTLRRHLERIKTNLMDIGITYQIGSRTRDGYPITFQKQEYFTSPSSHVHKDNRFNDLKYEDDVYECEDNKLNYTVASQGKLSDINEKCICEDNADNN